MIEAFGRLYAALGYKYGDKKLYKLFRPRSSKVHQGWRWWGVGRRYTHQVTMKNLLWQSPQRSKKCNYCDKGFGEL